MAAVFLCAEITTQQFIQPGMGRFRGGDGFGAHDEALVHYGAGQLDGGLLHTGLILALELYFVLEVYLRVLKICIMIK